MFFHYKEKWIMAFDEYKKREWKVVPESSPSAKHTPGDIVSFHGEETKVDVRCKRYGDGRYEDSEGNGEAGPIKGPDYKIHMYMGDNGKLRITCTPLDSTPIGGSWTAEDTSGGNDS